MKINLIAVAVASLMSLPVFAAEPNEIVFACKSKVAGSNTVQLYGRLTATGLTDVTYIMIDAWDADVKPTVRNNETWTADPNYTPTKKYTNYNRYQVQDNTPDQPEVQILIPNKGMVYALAEKQAKEEKETMVQGDFEGVVRFREDYHQDVGSQDYLKCITGWLTFK